MVTTWFKRKDTEKTKGIWLKSQYGYLLPCLSDGTLLEGCCSLELYQNMDEPVTVKMIFEPCGLWPQENAGKEGI